MTMRPIGEVLPHAGAMILLDRIERYDAESIVCLRRIEPGQLFVDADGMLPAWAGIELMAQTVAAWSGCQARDAGQPVRLGFLLGTRLFQCNANGFPVGSELRIEAVRSFHDEDGMGAFACRIEAGAIHAQARLTVFSPPDPATFLASLV
jgi:predicted hotdog family 3-hydroxylacyl-ACP dehydratase